MTTLREYAARQKSKARRRLSRFTNGMAAGGVAEVAGPREPLFGAREPVGVRAPDEPAFAAAPPGVSEPALSIPATLTTGFSLPEPEPFGRVSKAAQILEKHNERLSSSTLITSY